MDTETLLRFAALEEDIDTMERNLEEVLELPFVAHGPEGVYIPNGRDAHVAAANWLREHTERDVIVISSTLSRLPPDWPDDSG